MVTGPGRRCDRHRRRPHPRAGPRVGRHRTRGGVRPDRLVQSGVWQPGQLARRRHQHPHRTLRRRRRIDVPARDGVVGDRAADTRPRGRSAGVRPVPHPRARRQGGARPGAGVVSGRGDRDAGGGPDQGAHHGRRQSGAVDPRGPQARRGVAVAGRDDRRRPVAQRDHPARRRDPASAVAAGTAASRRPDPELRDQQHRELLAAGVRARRNPAARRSGRS